MLISVLICTYNRSGCIPDILDNLLKQDLHEGFSYEVLMVDNNSKDKTRETVETFVPKFQGKLRYLFEPKQGKTYALNLGIKEAKGDIIAFTDDDCLLEKNYLFNIYEAYHQYGNDLGVLGGKIIPHWANGNPPEWIRPFFTKGQVDNIAWSGNDKPSWLDRFFQGPVGVLDYGPEPFTIDYTKGIHMDDLFYGGNIVIRKNLLDQYGYFNSDKKVTEDSDVCFRLFKAGIKGLYLPQLIVHHKTDVQEITPKYYYKWWYLNGLYRAMETDLENKYLIHPWGTFFHLINEIGTWLIKSLSAKSLIQKVFCRAMARFTCGQVVQIIKRKLTKK